jgi:hypothetical protein
MRIGLLQKPAGFSHRGYRCIAVDGKQYMAHRLAWLYVYGRFPKGGLDHKNRVAADNRISNLRNANQSQNSGNKKVHVNNRLGLKGVRKMHKNWQARIMLNGSAIYLGTFATPEAAHLAYCRAAKKLYGEFFHNGN